MTTIKKQENIINELGLTISANGWARLRNPFDLKVRYDKPMAISFDRNTVICFRTGYRKSIRGFLKDLGYKEEELDLFKDFEYKPFVKKGLISLPNNFKSLSEEGFFQKRVLRYLESRKQDLEFLSSRGVGYCEGGLYSGRIIIPCYGKTYEFKGFIARTILNSYPKYYMKTSEPLFYNEYALCSEDKIYILEGCFDAFEFKDQGVANLTKIISNNKLRDICNSYASEVYFCPDKGAYYLYLSYAVKVKSTTNKKVFISSYEDSKFNDVNEAGLENTKFKRV
jgi:hypothetical protein